MIKRFFTFKATGFNYLAIAVMYTFALLFYRYFVLQQETARSAYDSFFFYFDASLADFQLWFPRFGFMAFMIFSGLKLLVIILLCWFAYKRVKKTIGYFLNDSELRDFNFQKYLKQETLIAVTLLLYYLFFYYIFRYFFGSETYFPVFQTLLARGFLLHLLLQLFFNLIQHRHLFSSYIKTYLFAPQLPYNIAILRILFFSYLAFLYTAKYFTVLETIGSTNREELPFIGWLIKIIPLNPELYGIFCLVGIITTIFVAIGFKTRFFLLINAICCFYIIATPNFFGKLWHEQLLIWISWFFTFSKCYDVFSIDAFLRKTKVRQSADYTFPVRFVWLQFAIIYFWAGFYKLWDTGFDWALSRSMISQVQLEWLQNYDQVPALRIDQYPVFLYVGGMCVILFELSYFLFILNRSWRWIAAIGGILMHCLTTYFLYISFFFALWIFYFFYIDFNALYLKVTGKIKANISIADGYSRRAFNIGAVILGLNFVCGMFSIDSYPFSAYPKYSAKIPETLEMLAFECNNSALNFHETGHKNHFRWEDYGWLEFNIIADLKKGLPVEDRLRDYLDIWLVKNPELQMCDSVKVYLQERPVAPEGKYHLKKTRYICTFSLN